MKFFKATSLLLLIAVSASFVEATSSNDDAAHPSNGLIRRLQGIFSNSAKKGEDIIVVLNSDDNTRRLDAGTSRKTIAKIALEKRNAAADIAQSLNVVPEQKYGASIYGFSARGVTPEKRAEIESDPRVAYVETDQIIQLDDMEMTPGADMEDRKLRGRQLAPPPGKGPGKGGGDDGGDSGPSQTTPWGITRVKGGATYSGSNVAWVLDSGIDLDHPDLNVEARKGFNAFSSGRDGRSLDDGNGHGTHVAGTIAAIDNSIGVIGVAAGATVVPVKVLDRNGSGRWSGIVAGIEHVAANGSAGDVANMSLGGTGDITAVNDAVMAAAKVGIIFVLAAGNSGKDASNYSPARTNGDNIYTISASDFNDDFASFSNYGSPVDYCAPGVYIDSTWKNGGYNSISGTSMAAPHAAGVLLLGNPSSDGTVSGDPDGSPDPIISR